MTVTVHIPEPLQKWTKNQATVEVADVISIDDVIDSLEWEHPGIKDKLVENGEIRKYLNIFLNDEDIEFMKDEDIRLNDGDSVFIIPSIAGGN
ncbi:MAG: MoaD/ThiS family protein [Gemmatimonadota bacterium]|nr:MoaD/ThiS family protein [Gemmatimonadota bacterium]